MPARVRYGYSRGMQVRLSLRRSGAVLSYAIPLWYRALAVLIVVVICLAIVGAGGTGVPGWILLGLAVFAALYEERWVFDTATGSCRCRMGLLFANRGPSFTFGDVEVVRLDVFVKGTLDQGVRPESDKMPLHRCMRSC